jgi:putative DNA primase/helicase
MSATPKIQDQAKDRWPSLLPLCGVPKDLLTGRHVACPFCDKKNFRFDDKEGRGTWICTCGSGSGIDLLMQFNGWDFKTVVVEVRKHVGTAPIVQVRRGPPDEQIKQDMNRIWASGVPLDRLDATSRWWDLRVGSVPTCKDLRAVANLKYVGRESMPAMVALVRDVDGKPINLHRTYLKGNGEKADVDEPRRLMPGELPRGAAVRLSAHEDVLGVAEGIETAIAAQMLFGLPCWATLTANRLGEWDPPPGVTRVKIFGDNDRSHTGHAAAFRLSWRLRLKKIETEVLFPDREGWDWNDVLDAKRHPLRDVAA